MSRYTGPKCRLCRREGVKLFLKGLRCSGPKCALNKKQQAPGMHGNAKRRPSAFGLQLRAKQRVKRAYGLLERAFRNYYEEAARVTGVTGEVLLNLLERRLDNAMFRSGLAMSRAAARKSIVSGKATVNGIKVTHPSYSVGVNDTLTLAGAVIRSDYKLPTWLELNAQSATAKVVALPTRDQIDADYEEQLIVEYYSR
ncbi:MAG: 30S ribosomal protein S4 [candidate division WWE3 bacterium]|nr:30S ribosomal protein S4 [candidate division WWE3 bacterium]